MQARNGRGTSAWSAALGFVVQNTATKPPAPTPLGPTGTTSDSTPTYSWTGSSLATEYQLWVNDAAGTRVQQTYTAASVGCAAGGTCSTAPTTELGNGSARFWVQAKNAAGSSAWSAAANFVVSAGPAVWLAYIADHTPGVDELWAVRVRQDGIGVPMRVNAPLLPGQSVTWMRWTADGKRLVYAIDASRVSVVDMTGSAPATPRHLNGVGRSLTWSPNGRYLAFLNEVNDVTHVSVADLSDPGLALRSVAFCPADGCFSQFGRYYPPDWLQWSGSNESLFAYTSSQVAWAVQATNGVPASPSVLLDLTYAYGGVEIDAFHVSPFGAQAVAAIHVYAGSIRYLGVMTPTYFQGYSAALPYSDLERWLPDGSFAYYGAPYGSSADTYIHHDTRVFDVAGERVGWEPAPDVRTLAIVVNDSAASDTALYLRRRNPNPSPEDSAIWRSSSLAISDFSRIYAWAPDSRHLLYAKGSLVVLDTGVTPLPAPRPLSASIPAGATATSIAWGRTSNRIFYTTSESLNLKYLDFRDGATRPPASVTPAYSHVAGDNVRWALAPNDDFVAASADFTQDGVFELYVTSVSGSAPGAIQRVHPALSGAQSVAAFAWQPALPAAP